MSAWESFDRPGTGETGAERRYAWAQATILRNRYTKPGVWMLRASALQIEDAPIRCDSLADAQRAAHRKVEERARELFAAVEGSK